MTRFNFVRSPQPAWLLRLRKVQIPERLQGGLLATGAVLVILAGGAAIERFRLGAAHQEELACRIRLERTRIALSRARVYYDDVRALMRVDERLTQIAASGDVEAHRLAELGNAVPAHVWFTAIDDEQNGISIDGETASLRPLTELLSSLGRVPSARSASLTNLQSAGDGSHRTLQYHLALQSASQ